jgi:hypothetical protein
MALIGAVGLVVPYRLIASRQSEACTPGNHPSRTRGRDHRCGDTRALGLCASGHLPAPCEVSSAVLKAPAGGTRGRPRIVGREVMNTAL